MSTIVYQGIQPSLSMSCYESHVTYEPRSLTLKLYTPTQQTRNPSSDSSWSCIQSLPSNSSIHQKENKVKKADHVYVHPLCKRSSSMLSERSLEMCTENLGSETGSEMSSSDFMESEFCLSLPHVLDNNHQKETKTSSSEKSEGSRGSENVSLNNKKVYHKKNTKPEFPPPITTIRGTNSLHVKRHCVGDRLVLESVSSPSTQSYLVSARSGGRLRLSLPIEDDNCNPNTSTVTHNYTANVEQEDPSTTCINDIEGQRSKIINSYEHTCKNNSEDEKEDSEGDKEEKDTDLVEQQEDKASDNEAGDEIDHVYHVFREDHLQVNTTFNVCVTLGVNDEFQSPGRCNEGGRGHKRLITWEPFWVATS